MTTPPGFERGTPHARRVAAGLFAGGVATFALLYSPQPLLPLIATAFGQSPAAASLTVSVATFALAASLIVTGAAADRFARRSLMAASLLAAAALGLACALAPRWPILLILRALQGAALGGLPALAMTYLAEEASPRALAPAMGLYVGGTAIGGMSGRLLAGLVADATGSWRWGQASVGLLGVVAGLVFLALLPHSRRFTPRPGGRPAAQVRAYRDALATPGLAPLLLVGFALMGAFVTLFNYLAFRPLAPPFHLSQAEVSLIFIAYLVGAPTSPAFGSLAQRVGEGRALALAGGLMLAGVALTAIPVTVAVVIGVLMFTAGFFGGHTAASGAVARNSGAAKAKAASLYLVCYYCGGGIVGALAGLAWSAAGWDAVAALMAGLILVVLIVSMRTAPSKP